MHQPSAQPPPLIESGVASWSLTAGHQSGDLHLVKPFPNGTLVAVVDALGHGPEAATVARLAIATLEGQPHESVVALMMRCHQALRATRGAVMSLASFDEQQGVMTWMGVGNVEAVLVAADGRGAPERHSLLLRGGVVGDRLPRLQPTTLPLGRGDLLILATDGIRANFVEGLRPGQTPQEVADHILARYAKQTDDALVLAVRYAGGLL